MKKRNILIAETIYGEPEKKAVNKVLDSGWLGEGKYTTLLEKQISDYIGVKHAIFVNSGSSALLLGLKALNLPAGSEVITCAAGFPSTMNPIFHAGLKPVVVDCELDTLNIDPKKALKAMTKKTSAIVFAHAAGNPVDLDALKPIMDRVPSVEDTADALGSKWGKKMTGSFGTVSALSFYASHHMTAGGGGGMVLTDSTDLATTMYSLRDWGKTYKSPEYYQTDETKLNIVIDGVQYDRNYGYDTIGFNFKLIEMGAAFGTEQFKRLPGFVKARNRNFDLLQKILRFSWTDYFIPIRSYPNATPSWFFFPFILRDDCSFSREDFMVYLESKGIHTRLFFAGNILRHPALKKKYIKVVGGTTNADKLMSDALMIGIHPGMELDDVQYVVDMVNKFLQGK